MVVIDNDKQIIVRYQTAKTECRCCGRPFEKIEDGEEKNFKVTLQKFFKWAHWETFDDIYDEELNKMVEEYLWDTIHFYACGSEDKLLINQEDIIYFIQMVKNVIEKMKV